MGTILYVLLACILTPLALEFFNRRTAGNQIVNAIQGWSAYTVNVAFCALAALIVCFLPGGPGISLGMWAVVTFAIYFGNQFVFQTFIKTIAKYRKG